MCCYRVKSEDNASIICKSSSAAIRCSLGPQAKSMKPRTPADRAPCIGVVRSQATTFVDERQQQFAIRRKITFFWIDAPFQPGARIELIALGAPANDMKPVRRTSTEDDGFMCFTRKYHKKTRGDFLLNHICTRRQRSKSNPYGVAQCREEYQSGTIL